ncbi:MAG: hypothetical protein DBX47_02470 [Clostridiales bacterium]|nr:MAG: hypothetical protein DBX47_02470 [Clostridiales bacterium]
MKQKTLFINILLIVLVFSLYIGSAVFMSFPEITPEQQASVEVDSQHKEDVVEPKKETNEDGIERYDEEPEREGEVSPRSTYSLSLPSVIRSDQMLSNTLKKTDKQPYSYFDDALFIGDSVGIGLQNYVTEKRKTDKSFMGKARFLCVGSYGVYEATRSPDDEKSIHKIIGGEKKPPSYFIKEYNSSKVFICLGLNDVGLYSKKEYIENYLNLVTNIREAAPDVQIIIQSITPVTLYGERRTLYNSKIDEYNEALAEFSATNGCFFADIGLMLKDKAGYLAAQLSSDDYCHLETEAYDIWIDYLLTHAVGL